MTHAWRVKLTREAGRWVRHAVYWPPNSRARRRRLQHAAVLFDRVRLPDQAAACRQEASVVTPPGDPIPEPLAVAGRKWSDDDVTLLTAPPTKIDVHGRLTQNGVSIPVRPTPMTVGVAGNLFDGSRPGIGRDRHPTQD